MRAFWTYLAVFTGIFWLLGFFGAPFWAALAFGTLNASICMATVALLDFGRANLPKLATPQPPALPSAHS